MKKFLLVLSFTLIASHLFSNPLKEKFYKKTISNFINNVFLENVKTEINSVLCLRYLAEKYLELLKQSETYENALTKLNEYLVENDMAYRFGLDSTDKAYVTQIFQEQLEVWLKMTEFNLEENSINTIERAKVLADMSPEETIQYFEKENIENSALLTSALIKTCTKILPEEVNNGWNKMLLGIAVGTLGTAAVGLGVRMLSGGNEVHNGITISPVPVVVESPLPVINTTPANVTINVDPGINDYTKTFGYAVAHGLAIKVFASGISVLEKLLGF